VGCGGDVATTVLVNFALTKKGTIVTLDPRLGVAPVVFIRKYLITNNLHDDGYRCFAF
jgi:hypothetical protein